MGSITIKKNGVTRTFGLSYLDWKKAQAANVANSGVTDIGNLIFTQDNALCEGTLDSTYIPEGATNKFYIFKSTNFPTSLIQGYTPIREQRGGKVLYFGAFQEPGDNINDFFPPAPEDDRPPSNYTVDVTNPEEFKWWGRVVASSYYGPVYKTGNTVHEIFINYNALGYFETMAGCTFGASMDMVGGNSFGVTAGIQIHSYGPYKYLNDNVDRIPTLTGNQAYGGKPWGPRYDGQLIISYPSNEVAYNAYVRSIVDWSIMPDDVAIADIGDDITAEFVCTTIDGVLYAGLAACRWTGSKIDMLQVTLLPAWFWGAGSMDLTFDFEIPDYSDTWYGPDSSPNPGGSGGYIVRQTSAQIADVPARSYWSFIGQGNAGTHCYLINGTALAKLQEALWNSLVTDEFKQYILSCIVALHQMPNELMPAPNASNAVSSITIGNIPVPISGGAKAQIVDPFVSAYKVCSFSASDPKQSLGYFNGGNYLDYEPHVSVTLFLPFAGTLQLSASQCIGGKIEVYVASNASNGDCVYTVVTTSDGKILKDADGNPVKNTYYVAGNSAMPIMISGTTTGQKQRQSDIFSMIGGAVTMATGAAAGNVGVVAHGALGVLEAKNALDHIQQNAITAGGIAGSVAGLGQKQVILRVTRPVKAYDKRWIDLGGIRSEMSGKLEKAKTADSASFTVVKFCNTSTLRATEAEKAEVLEILKGGVYL